MDKKYTFLIWALLLLVSTAVGQAADLAHRWSFNGDLADSVGGVAAEIVDQGGNDATLSDAEVTLAGGAKGSSDYIEIPAGTLSSLGDTVTVEIWATQRSIQNWSRIFDFGTSTTHNVFMSWTVATALGNDRVEWVGPNGSNTQDGTNAPYTLDTEFHIVVVFEPGSLTWYTAPADAAQLGQAKGTFNTSNVLSGLADDNIWLGRSEWPDNTASASYDEFRLWVGALTQEEMESLHAKGPDANFDPDLPSSPTPADEATDVRRETGLAWAPGESAVTHDVYLGTVFDDVNDATRDNPLDVLVSQGQSPATWDSDIPLDFGQTYYWRVDEWEADGATMHKGAVWSFSTESYSYLVPDVNVTASVAGTSDPNNLVNDPNAHGTSTEDATMWRVKPPSDVNEVVLDFDLGAVYRLDEMRVWNFNNTLEGLGYLGFSVKDIAVESSIDGETWTALGDHTLTQGLGTAANPGQVVKLEDAAAQYVRLIAKNTYGGTNFGLSEVHFYYIPTKASEPEPASGTEDLDPAVTLSWRSGRETASHRVYLDTDPNAVADETTSFITANSNMLDPGVLDLGQIYYWKVVEVNEAEEPAAWPSDVWDFSTTEFISVDDFESYTDEPGEEVFNVWADGYGIADNGSQVSYDNPPYMETTIVHGGDQSMAYFYGRGDATNSEATMDVGGANWTYGNAKTLVLYFHGDPENDPAQLYVKIGTTRINYPGDSAGLAAPLWKQWNIDLTGISISRVASLTIGVDGPGSGLLFIDDIRLYREAPAMPGPAVDPGTANLKAYYPMSGSVADTSGNNRNGTVGGAGTGFGDGPTGYGQAMTVDGSTTAYATIPVGPLVQASDSMTVTAWVSRASGGANQRVFDFGNDTDVYMFMAPSSGGGVRFAITTTSNAGESEVISDDPLPADGSWHHVAIVIDADAAELNLYVDGALADTAAAETLPSDLGNTANNWISRSQWTADPYLEGAIDEFRIYDRALSDAEVRYLLGDR